MICSSPKLLLGLREKLTDKSEPRDRVRELAQAVGRARERFVDRHARVDLFEQVEEGGLSRRCRRLCTSRTIAKLAAMNIRAVCPNGYKDANQMLPACDELGRP